MENLNLRSLTVLFASIVLTSSCSESIPTEVEKENNPIPINISMSVWQTKATDTGYEVNDKVGLFVVNNASNGQQGTLLPSGNHVDNMLFTYSSTGWTPEKEIFWADKTTKADIYAYYPFTASANISTVENYPFTLKKDQSTEVNYKSSDFLWGKVAQVAPTSEAVPVITNHLFSNIIVKIIPGKGYTTETLAQANKSVKVCSVKTDATINLATGVATATGLIGEVTPHNEGERYRALIAPQTIVAGSKLIQITIDGTEYQFTKGFTFEANKQHTFSVTVNKTSGGIDIGVGGWETDENENGGNAE